MKKIIALILVLVMISANFAACSNDNGKVTDANDSSSESALNTSDTSEADTSDDTSKEDERPAGSISDVENRPDAKTNDVTTADIANAVKELLGEEYRADADIDAEFLSETYGVKSEWTDDFYAQIAMVSFNIDTFIAVKAKDGCADDVEKALTDYRQYTIDNTLQYPMNVPKLKGSLVYRVGNYVFYILLGDIPDEAADDENKAYESAVKNNMRVIEKINEIVIAE